MKQNVGVAAIVGAVALIAVVVFVLYKVTLAPKGPDPAAAAPEHKNMAEFYRNQGRVGGSSGAPAPAPQPGR
jgi:hypothetical protein